LDTPEDYFEFVETRRNSHTRLHPKGVALACLIKGEIDISFEDSGIRRITANSLFVIHHGNFSYRSIEDSGLLCFYLKKEMEFCGEMRKKIIEKPQKIDRNETVVLEMNGLVRDAISRFLTATAEGIRCKIYVNAFVTQLITSLPMFVASEQLQLFYAHLCCSDSARIIFDSNFRAKVLEFRNKVFTIKEFAGLMNMNRETFRSNFVRIFGISPKTWILYERKRLIYRELTEGNKNVLEIAELAGFASEKQVFKFSKNIFGETAFKIRFGKKDGK
jgi:AraC-like DNA-binding protein